MLISFRLSMPNCGSWNGKWGGSDRVFAIVKNIRTKRTAEMILKKESYSYNFGDGWRASISVEKIDAAKARKLRKQSVGFSGYDWMVDSIFCYGDIRA